MSYMFPKIYQIRYIWGKGFSLLKWTHQKSYVWFIKYDVSKIKKIITQFPNLGEKMGEENEALILLNSLPKNYTEVKTTDKYDEAVKLAH